MLSEYSKVEEIYDFDTKRSIGRLVVLLPGAGCEWAKKTGGCTMCGFSQATSKYSRGKLLPASFFVAMVGEGIRHQTKQAKELWIYNGGSFLNSKEIPNKAQMKIFDLVGNSSFEKLVIESRPEYIKKEKLEEIQKRLRSTRLVVAIGLESQDDGIRNKSIKKGISRKQYELSIRLLESLGIEVLTYVFLKPIGLTERQAIAEAIKTAEYCFNAGSGYVALEPAFIQDGTEMSHLYNKGIYRPPWLWSIISVMEKIRMFGPSYLGGFDDEPKPVAIPRNCGICDSLIIGSLNEYRKTNDFQCLASLNCDCRERWREELGK